MNPNVLEELTEEECYLYAILTDDSGVDPAEFLWTDERRDNPDGLFRCWDYQVPWYRDRDQFQIDQCARSVGKSLGIQLRAFAFPFSFPNDEMLVTAPELIHLEPVTGYIADRLLDVRLSRELLEKGKGAMSNGIKKRPFEARFGNGSKIIGRIPNKDGKGVKGMHPARLEMDEAQDYPAPGWVELRETLRFEDSGSSWRAHGVTRGVRDDFYKATQQGSHWKVHRITAMHRPGWSDAEREQKAEDYGGRHSADYGRNVLGLHGDATSPLFVLTRLMACVDSNEGSDYNTDEYYNVRITEEAVRNRGGDILEMLDFPVRHKAYGRTWVGMDVGLTNHPTEILIFGEVVRNRSSQDSPATRLKLLARLHLERIAAPDQRKVLEFIYDYYRPQAIGMDGTGIGLPIWQEAQASGTPSFKAALKSYNFSSKIVVGYEEVDEEDWIGSEDIDDYAIKADVLTYSSDQLRLLVDREQLILPWDRDLLGEFQGQTYTVKRTAVNPYGKKQFNAGKFHCLDAARMAVTPFVLQDVDKMREVRQTVEPVLDTVL